MFKKACASALLALSLAGCASDGVVGNKVDDESILGCTILDDTYECFDGKIYDVVAESEPLGQAGVKLVDRRPQTVLRFGGAEVQMDFAGMEVNAPRLVEYTESILAELIAVSPIPAPEISVHILADPNFGAFVTPSNEIYVNLGSFHVAERQDELAFMLAHELAHILLRHDAREEIVTRHTNYVDQAAGVAFMASGLLSTRFVEGPNGQKQIGSTAESREQARNVQIAAEAAQQTLNFVGRDVVDSAWSRRQEDEADLLGVDLMIKAGYGTAGPQVTFGKMQALYDRGEQAPLILEQDFAALADAAAQSETLDDLAAQGINIGLGVLARVGAEMRDLLSQSHANPETRRGYVNAYLRREYARGADPNVRAGFLDADGAMLAAGKERGSFDAYWRRYSDVFDAQAALGRAAAQKADGQPFDATLREGFATLERALSGSRAVANDPLPRSLRADYFRLQGDHARAIQAVSNLPAGMVLQVASYQDKAVSEIRLKRYADAERTLRGASQIYGDERYYPVWIQLGGAARNSEMVNTYKSRCAQTGLTAIAEACSAELSKISQSLGGTEGLDTRSDLEKVQDDVGGALLGGGDATDASQGDQVGTPSGGPLDGAADSVGGLVEGIGSLFSSE